MTRRAKHVSTDDEHQDDGIDALIDALRGALLEVTAAIKRTKGDIDQVKQAVNIATELRKLEVARRKRTSELTLAQVVAWLRQQPQDERARVERELHSMSKSRGVLG